MRQWKLYLADWLRRVADWLDPAPDTFANPSGDLGEHWTRVDVDQEKP